MIAKINKFYQHYFYLSLILLAAFIPLYPKFPILNVPGTFVAVRLEDFLIAVVILIWLAFNLTKARFYLNQTIIQLFILFWLIGGLSVLSGILITNSVTAHLGLFHWLRRIEFMLLFLVAANSFSKLKQLKLLLVVLIVTTIAVSFYGFGQIWLHFPVVSTSNNEYSKGLILRLSPGARVNSTFAGQYDLAIFLNMMLAILSAVFFYYRKLYQKVILLFTGGISFVLLTLTTARMSFAATLASVTLAFWLTGRKIMIGLIALAAVIALIISPDLRHRIVATVTVNILQGGGPKYNPPPGTINIFTPLQKIPPDQRNQYLAKALQESTVSSSQSAKVPRDIAPGEPINSTELGVYRSFEIRTNVEWPRAVRAFLKNPFLGTGYSSLTLATDNDILRSFGETGLLGSIALLLIFLFIVKKLWQFMRSQVGFKKLFTVGILASIVGIFITSTFIDTLESSKIAEVFWLTLGANWALMKVESDD